MCRAVLEQPTVLHRAEEPGFCEQPGRGLYSHHLPHGEGSQQPVYRGHRFRCVQGIVDQMFVAFCPVYTRKDKRLQCSGRCVYVEGCLSKDRLFKLEIGLRRECVCVCVYVCVRVCSVWCVVCSVCAYVCARACVCGV